MPHRLQQQVPGRGPVARCTLLLQVSTISDNYNVFDDGVQFLILEEVPKSLYMDTAFRKWSFLNELSALKNVCLQISQLTGSIKEKVLVGACQALRTCLLQNTVLYLHCMTACVQGPHHLRGLRAADGEGPGGERGGCVRPTL